MASRRATYSGRGRADGAATGDAGRYSLAAAGGCAAVVWGSTSAATPTARPTSQGPVGEPLGRVPSQKSPATTRARLGAPAVPEMLSSAALRGIALPTGRRTQDSPRTGPRESRWLGDARGRPERERPGRSVGTLATD